MTTKPSMQSEAAAAVVENSAAVGRGVEATEEQARAIIATAKRAVEEAKTIKKTRADGAGSIAGKPPPSSLKRSLECFLQGRKNKPPTSSAATRRNLESSTAASSSSSSSSN